MLTPVVLLPLAAVLINDVRTEVKDGALTVEVATSEAVAASDIRVATGGLHKLYVYLDDTTAKQSTFGEGAGAVLAHARARYTKLEIPTAERCGEPIGVVRTADGLRVRAACRDSSSAKGTASTPARVAGGLDVERPLPDAPQSARTRESQSQSALRAALALPTEGSADDTAPGARVEGNSKLVADSGKAKAGIAAKEEAREAAKVAPARHVDVEVPAAATASEDGADGSIKGAGNEKSSSGPLTTVLAVALLAGMGIVTFVFARKRGSRERVIRIVETASIGPRRSLVVASVGGRTMVLGVSEAGVSLLDSPASLPGAVGMPKTTEAITEAALGLRNLALAAPERASEEPAEEKHESSLLSRLFHRKPRESEGLGREDFEQLFAESMEDEELRRKLALGQSGRIA
jgi:flagellar biogenesis protein FliO